MEYPNCKNNDLYFEQAVLVNRIKSYNLNKLKRWINDYRKNHMTYEPEVRVI